MPALGTDKVGFGKLYKNNTHADILEFLRQSDNRAESWFNFCTSRFHTWVQPHPFLEVWRFVSDRHPCAALRHADNTYEAGSYEYSTPPSSPQQAPVDQDSDDELVEQLANLSKTLTELTLKVASKKSKK